MRVGIALLALVALRRELARVQAADIWAAVTSLGSTAIGYALICAAASFLILALFEVLALRDTAGYDGGESASNVPNKVAIVTSFVANALSQSIGFAVLTGSAIRMRVYSRYKVSTGAVAHVSAFVTVTATLGLMAAGAVALIQTPAALPARFGVSLKVFGIALSLPALAYVAWSVIGRGTIGNKQWSMRPPSTRLAFGQIGLSVVDWLLTGTVLFVLLPAAAGLSYLAFLSIYLIAQTAGVVSHVPAGFGVFEGAFISLLAASDSSMSTSVIAASLVVYRVIYYLIPLVAAIAIAAVADLRRRAPTITLVPRAPAVLVAEVVNAR